MNMVALTTETFSEILSKNQLAVVDFWAEWCEPCKIFTKVVESLIPTYPEVVFGSVDIEREEELADDFHIVSVPTVMIIKNQVVVYADSGSMSASTLAELIDQAKTVDVSK